VTNLADEGKSFDKHGMLIAANAVTLQMLVVLTVCYDAFRAF
jgi:hypothetical protein